MINQFATNMIHYMHISDLFWEGKFFDLRIYSIIASSKSDENDDRLL